MPPRLLLLCWLLRSLWLTVEGGRYDPAGMLHRRGGRAALGVSVSGSCWRSVGEVSRSLWSSHVAAQFSPKRQAPPCGRSSPTARAFRSSDERRPRLRNEADVVVAPSRAWDVRRSIGRWAGLTIKGRRTVMAKTTRASTKNGTATTTQAPGAAATTTRKASYRGAAPVGSRACRARQGGTC